MTRSHRPPSLNLSLSSRDSSPSRSSSESAAPAAMRVYPSGPYCFKQPTLHDVLSNTAPPPYTLSAFMAYLSQNHCLETLEFTMDASRYRKHYNNITNPSENSSVNSKDCAFVRKLWRKLLDAYIVPNGPREVNLPCNIRDQILSIPNLRTPPPPEALDPAVEIVHELMQESVLVPFLSEMSSSTSYTDPCPVGFRSASPPTEIYQPFPHGTQVMGQSLDERMLHSHRAHSPPSPVDYSASYSVPPRHHSRSSSPFSAALGWHHSRASSQPQHSSQPHHGSHSSHSTQASHVSQASQQSWQSSDMLMEDNSGASTPNWGSPMTPPTTPPAGEFCTSPRKGERGWKRMAGGLGRGLGWGRKKEGQYNW
ncbi:RGS domain-containing protein [Pyronema domesticum]|nr:RGS domain-containing protein [Pyronema domesticum]